jgi:two-component system chemotaxis response regulator CheB
VSTTRHSVAAGPFDAVVVVGSQGALDSFQTMVGCLPEGFPAAVIFDLHRGEGYGVTEQVLRRRCPLPVHLAGDGVALGPGQIYLAPYDRQLVIGERGTMGVLGPVDGVGHRFADTLFTSAGRMLGPRVIGVVLSGRLDGGARGVRELKRHGGRVMVEDPQIAAAPAMPSAALATGCVDFVLSPERLGYALVALCAATGAADLFRVRMNAAVAS